MASCSRSKLFLATGSQRAVRSFNQRAAAFLGSLVVASAGCSGDGLAVSGNVAYGGQSIAAGTITFRPVDDPTPGNSARAKLDNSARAKLDNLVQAKIVDGAYSVASHQSLQPGSYRVAVRAKRKAGQVPPEPGSTEIVDRFEQYIPPQYNSRTELTAEIRGDVEGLNFELEAPKRRSRRR